MALTSLLFYLTAWSVLFVHKIADEFFFFKSLSDTMIVHFLFMQLQFGSELIRL